MKPIGFSRNQTKSRVFSFTKDWLDAIPLYDIDFTKYKVVPLEPTEEMKSCMPEMFNGEELEQVYENMIEAAPDIEDL